MQNGELPADTFFPIPDYVTTGEGIQRTGGSGGGGAVVENDGAKTPVSP